MKANIQNKMHLFLTGVLGLLVMNSFLFAGQWSVNTGFQVLGGKYTSASNTSTFYLSGGLGYRTSRWNVSVNFPIIAQNTTNVTNMGGMFLPNGENQEHGGSSHWNMHGNPSDSRLTEHQMRFGLGDIYLYGEFQLLREMPGFPSVNITGQVKFPTASSGNNYGTGKFDYGLGLSLRKLMYPYSLFLDGGYIRIGDPVGITYRDPLVFGLGLGRIFAGGRYSFLIYYQQYSRILAELEPPRQATIAGFLKLADNTMLSASLLIGFSETSPDYGLLTTVGFTF